jgi:predicted HTH domain antitoxin
MNITLPDSAASILREAFGDRIDRAALETLVIEGYRLGRISLGKVAILLGLPTSIAAGQWLGTRGISLNYTADDLDDDRRTLDSILGPTH